MQPLLSMPAGGLRWLRVLYVGIGVAVLALLAALLLVGADTAGVLISVVSLVFVGAMFYVIVPRRYEIYSDSLRLVFPLFGWRVGFDTLEAFRPAIWWQAYGYWGVRFATAPSQAIEVTRQNAHIVGRPNLIISPQDRTTFLSELNAAYERFRNR